jgi:hypothetical protein
MTDVKDGVQWAQRRSLIPEPPLDGNHMRGIASASGEELALLAGNGGVWPGVPDLQPANPVRQMDPLHQSRWHDRRWIITDQQLDPIEPQPADKGADALPVALELIEMDRVG